jgi:hypothetical protein
MTKILIEKALVRDTLATLKTAEAQILALAPVGYIPPALGAIHATNAELGQVLEQPAQAQPWVGLNASDLTEIPPNCYEGAIWADARLKEKNT